MALNNNRTQVNDAAAPGVGTPLQSTWKPVPQTAATGNENAGLGAQTERGTAGKTPLGKPAGAGAQTTAAAARQDLQGVIAEAARDANLKTTPTPEPPTDEKTDDTPETDPPKTDYDPPKQPVTVVQNGQKKTGYVAAQPQEAQQTQPVAPNRYDTLSAYYNELYGGQAPGRAETLGAAYDKLYGKGGVDYDALRAYYDELYGGETPSRAETLGAAYDRTYGQGGANYDALRAYYDELYGGQTPNRAERLGAAYDELYSRAPDGYYDEAREYARGLYDESLGDIERQRGQINEQYAGTNRQLYRDYMNSLKNLPQQLAAQGYTGGLSESSRVRLDSGYGENLGANERARMQAMTEMEGQEAQARRQYNAALMDLRGQERTETRADEERRAAYLMSLQEQDYADELAAQQQRNAYMMGLREKETDAEAAAQAQRNAYMMSLQEQDYADRQAAQQQRNSYLLGVREKETDAEAAAQAQRNAYMLGLREQDYDAAQTAQAQRNAYLMGLREQEYGDVLSQRETDYARAAERAQLLAEYTGDFSGYEALGYSAGEIDALRRSWIAQNPELAKAMGYVPKSSGYSAVPSASTPAEEIAIMRAAGMTDSQIGAAYQTAINNDPELTAAEKAALRNAYKDEMVRNATAGLSAADQRTEQLHSR